MNSKNILYVAIGAGVLLVLGVALFFFRSTSAPQNNVTPIGFGVGDDRTVVIPSDTGETNVPDIPTPTAQKIFKVADGPVTSATLVQTTQPTTTLARYVLQENGHVLELALDNAGTVPRAISNTTIPGSVRALWVEGGKGSVLQYIDENIVKTVYLGFSQATSTASSTTPVHIQFFPDNITDVAVSPSGTQVAYLLSTAGGVDGYSTKVDGTGSTKLFTLPLHDVLLSWPANNTLLAQMKSAAGVQGIVFSISATSGNVVPLLTAQGVTATADQNFSHVIYQTISTGRAPTTYARNTTTGKDLGLSFDPIPEKCIWSKFATSTMYCATPIQYVPPEYLGLWYQGAASLPDAIISYDISTGKSAIVATPGSNDGGSPSDIINMSISPDNHYLIFVKKGERSLWGVRLAQ